MSKKKVQRYKQRSTKHTHKTKDRVTRTPLKPGMNLDAPEGKACPAPLVVPVVLILLQTCTFHTDSQVRFNE
jgi:hypothetical protein